MSDRPAQNARKPSGDAVEQAILAYLAERPDAADSLRGIAEWWMLHYTAQAVWNAVERLCQAGLLERLAAGNEPVYRLKRHDPDVNSREAT